MGCQRLLPEPGRAQHYVAAQLLGPGAEAVEPGIFGAPLPPAHGRLVDADAHRQAALAQPKPQALAAQLAYEVNRDSHDTEKMRYYSTLVDDPVAARQLGPGHRAGGVSSTSRRAPFGEARLIDTELTVDFAKETTPRDIVSDVRFRTDFVRFTSRSRPFWWCRRRSVPDPGCVKTSKNRPKGNFGPFVEFSVLMKSIT